MKATLMKLAVARALLAALAIGLATVSASPALGGSVDLRSYYPNEQTVSQHYYLEGWNYVTGTPQRAVLWFETLDNGKFKQFNSAPEDAQARCHWDLLQWSAKLTYSQTHHECVGRNADTLFSPAITLMPKFWNGLPWTAKGISKTIQTENGVIVATGTNVWRADVLGWETVAPGLRAIHIRSSQNTTWADGSVTHWQEDYYLAIVPKAGDGTTKAMKRHVGGNLDVPSDRWDVWFDQWEALS